MKRFRTQDKEATPILTTETIGPKRSKTPEGFLLCEDVPLARTGLMLYGPGEVPITPGRDGVARVTRDEKALFADATIASFNGKPVVNEHPDDDVTPNNWTKLSRGIGLNPRRGEDENSDVILIDLLITDAATIRDVESGKREVSAGYEADYEQTGDGEGRQTNIIGNHIALVDKGRCGPRCAIGDHQPKELRSMPTNTQPRTSRSRRPLPEAVRRLFRDAAEAMAEDPDLAGMADSDTDTGMGGDGDGDNHTHIHIHAGGESAAPAAGPAPDMGDDGMGGDMGGGGDPTEERFAALEQGHQQILEQLAMITQQLAALTGGGEATQDDTDGVMDDGSGGDPNPEDVDPTTKDGGMTDMTEVLDEPKDMTAGTKDGATRDSASLETSFRSVVADAEILLPGFRVPTFDAKKPRKITMDTMCAMRKRVLQHLVSTQDGMALVSSVAQPGFDASRADCATSATVFRAAAGAKKLLNNQTSTRDAGRLPASITQPGAAGSVMSLTEINEINKKFWAARQATRA